MVPQGCEMTRYLLQGIAVLLTRDLIITAELELELCLGEPLARLAEVSRPERVCRELGEDLQAVESGNEAMGELKGCVGTREILLLCQRAAKSEADALELLGNGLFGLLGRVGVRSTE